MPNGAGRRMHRRFKVQAPITRFFITFGGPQGHSRQALSRPLRDSSRHSCRIALKQEQRRDESRRGRPRAAPYVRCYSLACPMCFPSRDRRRAVFAETSPHRLNLRAHVLILVLQLVQLPIDAALGQQFLMGPLLAQAALVHHQDPGGALDRREAVRNHD
jgi:hypothetical protein